MPEDAPEEVVAKIKRKVQADKLGETLELKFNQRLDSCRVRDINTGQLVAVYDLNYKEDEDTDLTTLKQTAEPTAVNPDKHEPKKPLEDKARPARSSSKRRNRNDDDSGQEVGS